MPISRSSWGGQCRHHAVPPPQAKLAEDEYYTRLEKVLLDLSRLYRDAERGK